MTTKLQLNMNFLEKKFNKVIRNIRIEHQNHFCLQLIPISFGLLFDWSISRNDNNKQKMKLKRINLSLNHHTKLHKNYERKIIYIFFIVGLYNVM